MNSSGARLSAITKELAVHWQQTRESWSDAKSLEFETKYLQELFSSVERTLTTVEQLDKVLSQIRKDCE